MIYSGFVIFFNWVFKHTIDRRVGDFYKNSERFWKEIYKHYPNIYFHIFQEPPEAYAYNNNAKVLEIIYNTALTRLYKLTEYPYPERIKINVFSENRHAATGSLKAWIWINKHKETYWLL